MHGRRTIRWIQSVAAAYLAIALAVSPAWGVVVNIAGFDGYADDRSSASPTASVTFFLRHDNGKTYRVETDSRGVGKVDMPPGTITWCQAYLGDQLVSSWPCNIPVGENALRRALEKAETQTGDETPLAVDSQPNTVVVAAKKDGSATFLGYNPLLKLYFLPLYRTRFLGHKLGHAAFSSRSPFSQASLAW